MHVEEEAPRPTSLLASPFKYKLKRPIEAFSIHLVHYLVFQFGKERHEVCNLLTLWPFNGLHFRVFCTLRASFAGLALVSCPFEPQTKINNVKYIQNNSYHPEDFFFFFTFLALFHVF